MKKIIISFISSCIFILSIIGILLVSSLHPFMFPLIVFTFVIYYSFNSKIKKE